MGHSNKRGLTRQQVDGGKSAKTRMDILKRFLQRHSRQFSKQAVERDAPQTHKALNDVRQDLISLSELSSRLWRSLSLEHGLDEILAAAMQLMGAVKGNVQLFNNDALTIAAQSGFAQPFLDHFRTVSASDNSVCGQALRQREQIIVEDVEQDERFAQQRIIARNAGYRAVVSTPILNWQGAPLGMVSVHFDSPHTPSPPQLARLDQYIRHAGDFIQRFRTEQELHNSEEQVRAILDATADAIITVDGDGTILTFNRAAERIFGYSAVEVIRCHFSMLVPPDDRAAYDSFFRNDTRNAMRRIHGKPHNLYAYRKNGERFPVRLTVCEVDHENLYVGSIHDMSVHNALQEEVLRIASLEQQRIGQELHDGTQQELAGLGLLAQALVEELHPDHGKAHHMAARLAKGIAQTNHHVQALARGMLPVSIEGSHLMRALAELVSQTESASGLACRFECPQRVDVGSSEVATHLYKIVQEAISNAIKHAHCTTISVQLKREDSRAVVEIDDNGTGIHFQNTTNHGAGMRLMAYRSGLIGGELIIAASKEGGTSVKCSVALKP